MKITNYDLRITYYILIKIISYLKIIRHHVLVSGKQVLKEVKYLQKHFNFPPNRFKKKVMKKLKINFKI